MIGSCLAFRTLRIFRAFADKCNALCFITRITTPHVVVDRRQFLLRDLPLIEVKIVLRFVELRHHLSACLAITRIITHVVFFLFILSVHKRKRDREKKSHRAEIRLVFIIEGVDLLIFFRLKPRLRSAFHTQAPKSDRRREIRVQSSK